MVQGILIDVHYGMAAGPLMPTFADKGLRTATLNTFPDTVLQQTPLLATVYLLALENDSYANMVDRAAVQLLERQKN